MPSFGGNTQGDSERIKTRETSGLAEAVLDDNNGDADADRIDCSILVGMNFAFKRRSLGAYAVSSEERLRTSGVIEACQVLFVKTSWRVARVTVSAVNNFCTPCTSFPPYSVDSELIMTEHFRFV